MKAKRAALPAAESGLFLGQTFRDTEEAVDFVESHAKRSLLPLRKRHCVSVENYNKRVTEKSQLPVRLGFYIVQWECRKAGKRGIGCPAEVAITYDRDMSLYVVSKLNSEHNHDETVTTTWSKGSAVGPHLTPENRPIGKKVTRKRKRGSDDEPVADGKRGRRREEDRQKQQRQRQQCRTSSEEKSDSTDREAFVSRWQFPRAVNQPAWTNPIPMPTPSTAPAITPAPSPDVFGRANTDVDIVTVDEDVGTEEKGSRLRTATTTAPSEAARGSDLGRPNLLPSRESAPPPPPLRVGDSEQSEK